VSLNTEMRSRLGSRAQDHLINLLSQWHVVESIASTVATYCTGQVPVFTGKEIEDLASGNPNTAASNKAKTLQSVGLSFTPACKGFPISDTENFTVLPIDVKEEGMASCIVVSPTSKTFGIGLQGVEISMKVSSAPPVTMTVNLKTVAVSLSGALSRPTSDALWSLPASWPVGRYTQVRSLFEICLRSPKCH
jgi:hypothetical protein